MRNDLADITVVVDRSGSMSSCRTDAEGGLNHFIDEQKNGPGHAVLTLVQFDTEYEFVHKAIPIKDVPKYTLHPRGGTALLDAVGRAITEAGERLSAMSEADRPALVVFVILTDGQENSSKEFKKAKIKEMIQHQTDAYRWQFTFLAANQDAFAEGSDLGVPTAAIMNFSHSTTKQAYAAASSNTSRMRTASSSGETVANSYTDAERLQAASKS
jgi:hypothetical protein